MPSLYPQAPLSGGPSGAMINGGQARMSPPPRGTAPGQPSLDPKLSSSGIRPFSPGEFLRNPDGTWSNERTATIKEGEEPKLMGGKPTVIPTLWIKDGKPYQASEDEAVELAIASGLKFPAFKTNAEAEKFAQAREQRWQTMAPEKSAAVPPLWSR